MQSGSALTLVRWREACRAGDGGAGNHCQTSPAVQVHSASEYRGYEGQIRFWP